MRRCADYVSGKYDLAVQEFNDYLKYYGNTSYAPNAQFYIAMIHFAQGNYEDAVKEFDMVLEKYPGQQQDRGCAALQGPRAGQDAGAQDRRRQRIHGSDPALPQERSGHQACTERKALGLNCGAAASRRPRQAQEVRMAPLTTVEALAKLIDHPAGPARIHR